MWLERAREGRLERSSTGGLHPVRLEDGSSVRAGPSRAIGERGVGIEPGDAVLLKPVGDGFEIVMRRRFGPGREVPLTVPAADPEVEHLLAPGEPKWLHPYLPFLYDWYDAFDEDLPVWRRLAAETGGPILELACGTGRVMRELAREGHHVTGVDLSPAMVERGVEKLADEPEELRTRIDWRVGDAASWRTDRRFRLGIVAANSLHYLGCPEDAAPNEHRRRALATLFAHLEPGGRAAIANVAPAERPGRRERHAAPRLLLQQAGTNPNTGLFTAEYTGLFTDADTGRRYDGPWRFVEHRDDGTRRAFEFAPPPAEPGTVPLPDRPAPWTRAETVEALRGAGFADVEPRSFPDLGPPRDDAWFAVFLARRE